MTKEAKNKQEPEFFNLDVAVLDIRNKPTFEFNKIESEVSEDGNDVIKEPNGQNGFIYIEKVPRKISDLIGAALLKSSNDDKVDYKKRMNRGLLAQSIFNNPKKVQLTIPQITVILDLVEQFDNTLFLLRVSEVIDPENKIKPIDNSEI